ncbi:fimbrial protein [Klebsiella pneumoniae]|uniref:F4 family fimbrial subunit n=1 Tax=Escherichia coli TaxID=562 RepID=UPI000B7D2D17|nr:fimbrial protein [Escherichia coli]EIX9792519.1 fimbrial protein [Klebsiella pneumoniae]HBC8790757.1 fimbrial protein [Citrobacter braakii]EEY4091234.1 fimbrial protein [Escherichia coli]EHD1149720.1 fimbrial protein [Escherichia coli]MCN2810873.1 fimbrial protein [Escherichia coli]
MIKAIVATFFLFFSFHAFSSTILDGGEIRFRGYVTDNGPKWRWRVASGDKFWDVDTSESSQKDGKLVFNLKDKGTVNFLEGYLNEVVERGGPGMTPSISYTTGEKNLQLYRGTDYSNQQFRAGIPVYNPETGQSVGELMFTVEQGMAVTLGHQTDNPGLTQGMFLVSGESVSNVQPEKLSAGLINRLSGLLFMNKGFGNGMSTAGPVKLMSQNILADGQTENIAAAFASALTDFELHLPAEGTPEKWYAALNVTVTVH